MGDKLALYFAVDARYHKSGVHDNDLCIMRHVLIHRPANYTKVLVSPKTGFTEFETGRFLYGQSSEYFDKYSDHDSCWRSDGFRFLSDDYFKAAKKLKIPVPNDMESYIGFALLGDPKFVLVDELTKQYQDDRQDYIRGYNVRLKGQIKLRDVHQHIPEEL
jgi:hypothetical protein